jgi:hypothetical protein
MAERVESPEVLSPELVLIDPRLAVEARASAPDLHDALIQLGPKTAHSIAHETNAARQRLIELSLVEPPERRCHLRVMKLAGAMATWAIVAILAVDTQLYTLFR